MQILISRVHFKEFDAVTCWYVLNVKQKGMLAAMEKYTVIKISAFYEAVPI